MKACYRSSKVLSLLLSAATLLLGSCGKDAISLPAFRELPSPFAGDLTSIAFADSMHGAITGGEAWEKGFVLDTEDGGLSWILDTLTDRKMEHVCFDPLGQGYACGQDMLLYKPVGQPQWRIFRVDFQWLRGCHFPDGRRGAMVGGEGFHGGVVRTFGPDPFWATDTIHDFPNEIESIWYSDSVTVHAVGFGWVMRSTDAGRHWLRADNTGDFFQCVQFPTATTGYCCGNAGTILKTTDAGLHWKTIRKGGSLGQRAQAFRSLWFATADKGYIVGDSGLFWQTEDGGDTWQPVAEAPSEVDFTSVYMFGNKGWATAKGGRLFCF